MNLTKILTRRLYLYFFDKYFDKGIRWYEKHFSDRRPGQVAGELSHDYFSSQLAMERIRRYYPHVKILCCLRNPYDRALSSFKFFLRNGLVDENFLDAVEKYPVILHEGKYFTHLTNLYSVFSKEQVLVLFFDDLDQNPEVFARSIFNFLGVDTSFESDLIGKKINVASAPRSKFVAKTAKQIAILLRSAGFPNLVGRLKRNTFILDVLFKKDNISTTDSESNKYHVFSQDIIDIYNKEINDLEILLKKDLNKWKVKLG